MMKESLEILTFISHIEGKGIGGERDIDTEISLRKTHFILIVFSGMLRINRKQIGYIVCKRKTTYFY